MAKKFIDVDVLAKQIYKRVNNSAIRSWLFAIINETPAADVQEVKRGQWKDANEMFECSICGYSFENEGYMHFFNFCPNCGARMDGEET